MAGLLLTGGASRRMGTDKARIRVSGIPLAEHVAAILNQVAAPVLEVGPGHSGLPTAPEATSGQGPLAALADGHRALLARGHVGDVLVLATDLPLIDAATLVALRDWPAPGSVVPRHGGRPQPLCARWSPADLAVIPDLLRRGERALAPLLRRPDVALVNLPDPRPLEDADTPADLDALGLDWRPS
ncbi:MAG TPA: molybdenum cofactor guanylyltransferase [Solirubrobacteraceae bacterium]|nr:molybdenum cofactor guanylyltransferase [Solirubrobacteraceae bacterium]